MKRRKFNTYYWTCSVIAACVLLMGNIEWRTIMAIYLAVTVVPFFMWDDRGKFAFPDEEE